VHRNGILNKMSNADLALLQPRLAYVPLKFRQRLESANRQISTVYFLESGIASVVAVSNGERRQAEVAIVGREGMTGLPVVHGAQRSPCETFIQVEGKGQCISAEDLREVMEQSTTFWGNLLRYAHVFAVQCSYTALANAQGNIEERLARWLLMIRDRLESDEMLLTHEFIALMLGVRRAGVTTALQRFESRALIETSRGCVILKDREGLEACANGFYGPPEAEFERLFG
jgi:CRP-like cAMP-binding protein